jgi:hypothetical protein
MRAVTGTRHFSLYSDSLIHRALRRVRTSQAGRREFEIRPEAVWIPRLPPFFPSSKQTP